MKIISRRRKRLFFPKTVLFGLATAIVMATPAEAIPNVDTADDVGAAADGEVPTNTQAISEANSFAGGSYSSLTSFDLHSIVVTPPAATAGSDEGVVTGSDSSSDVATGFNVDLANSQYTKEGELLRISPAFSPNNTTITFNLSAPATKFGLFISDYGNAMVTNAISFDLLDSSDVSIGSGTIPIPVPDTSTGEASSISGTQVRSIVFWGATIGSDDNPISSIELTTDVSHIGDRFAIDEVRIQEVPFEVETGAGLVLLGGYFGWRRFRQRKQAVASDN